MPPIADHDGVFVSLSIKRKKVDVLKKTTYDYKNVDETSLTKFIKDYDYESNIFTLPYHKQAEALSKLLQEALKKFVPVKSFTCRAIDMP